MEDKGGVPKKHHPLGFFKQNLFFRRCWHQQLKFDLDHDVKKTLEIPSTGHFVLDGAVLFQGLFGAVSFNGRVKPFLWKHVHCGGFLNNEFRWLKCKFPA